MNPAAPAAPGPPAPPGPPGRRNRRNLLALIGPGILVAATGVGAGDLATASFTGNRVGLAVLWAVLLGAFLKYVLTEGLARWQLATGRTLLEGAVEQFGRGLSWLFMVYLVAWSFFVAAALMSACGVVALSVWRLSGNPEADKIVYGAAQSGLAVVLVWLGGYRLFSVVMSVCIAVMFAVVVATAVAIQPPWGEVAAGLVVPRIPDAGGQGLGWTIALMGGVGGTVTILCYGYWIREEGRQGIEHLATSRIDLGCGYVMTALFGVAMVIIGSQAPEVPGGGATLIVNLADALEAALGGLGPTARWAFLLGAWSAVFSSLLGVWQSVPYLFTDLWNLLSRRSAADPLHAVDTSSRAYRGYLLALASVPAAGLVLVPFATIQKSYAIVGAAFLPILAAALLVLNGRRALVGEHRNALATAILLAAAVAFFVAVGVLDVWERLGR